MSAPWHQKQPNVAVELRDKLEKKYPDLHFAVAGDEAFIKGSFPIVHDGVELDRFYIDVRVPAGFPEDLPVVYETAGRVPRDVDWHTFNAGNLCVVVPEEWFLNPDSHSLIAYLDGPLRNFFINHALAEAGQPRPMGERAHGSEGLLEAYGEIVGSTDPKTIALYLDYCAAKKLKRHWKCPCGSGVRLEACHLGHVIALRKRIPRWIAAKAYQRLNDTLRSEGAATRPRRT